MAENREYITYSEEKGSINISEEVVAAIAAGAALETDGVAALYNSPARDFAEIMGKRGVSRGARIKVEEEAIVATYLSWQSPARFWQTWASGYRARLRPRLRRQRVSRCPR